MQYLADGIPAGTNNDMEEASLLPFPHNTLVVPTWQFMAGFFEASEGEVLLSRTTKLQLVFTTSDIYGDHERLPIDRARIPPLGKLNVGGKLAQRI